MERINTWRRLSSYSVNKQLLQSLEDFINNKIPRILYSRSWIPTFSDYSSLLLLGSKDSEVFRPIRKYTQPQFNNDIQELMIELAYKEAGWSGNSKAIVLQVRLGKNSGDSDLSIALQDDNAKEKIKSIEEGLLAVLEKNKNPNRITYPNEFIPTLVFVGGFLVGLFGLMLTQPLLKSLCIIIFGIAIYFVARRFTKGYCSFESARQKQLDRLLNWLTGAVALFVLISLLSPLWK